MKKIILTVTILMSLIYFSCSSVTDISGTWRKPGTTAKKYNKIMVLGLSGDLVKRATVEKAIVSKLRSFGINAVSSVNVFPDSFVDSDNNGKIDNENKEAYAEKIKEQGVDGVFTISLMDVKESEYYVPGTTYYAPSTMYYPFYSYYWNTYNVVHTPGYMTKSTNYFLASNFYDLSNDQLVWSAQSETVNPQSLNDFAKSYSTAVVDEFINSNILRK